MIALIEQVEGIGRVYRLSNDPDTTPWIRVSAVMYGLSADILKRLSPDVAAAAEPDSTEITNALSRMIRDAEKGFSSVKYNFDRVRNVLERLGKLMIDKNPINEWARQYNSL